MRGEELGHHEIHGTHEIKKRLTTEYSEHGSFNHKKHEKHKKKAGLS
jgi:hypothetical protein